MTARRTPDPRPSGYSGTPLVRKLGIKVDSRVALIDPPEGLVFAPEELPPGVSIRRTARGPLDVMVAFFDRRARLERRLPTLRSALQPAGGVWIAWPKRSSGVSTDLDENVVRACGLAAGLVDNKVCAIDSVWSGLRFVVRLRDR